MKNIVIAIVLTATVTLLVVGAFIVNGRIVSDEQRITAIEQFLIKATQQSDSASNAPVTIKDKK